MAPKKFLFEIEFESFTIDRASLEWLIQGLKKNFRGQPTDIFQKNVEIFDMGNRVLPVYART